MENQGGNQPTDDDAHDSEDNEAGAMSAYLYLFYVDPKTAGEPCSGHANDDIGQRPPQSKTPGKKHEADLVEMRIRGTSCIGRPLAPDKLTCHQNRFTDALSFPTI